MNAVNGDKKKHSEWIVRSSNNLYSPPEQVATGPEARWCGERTGSLWEPVQRKRRYARYAPVG